MGWLFSLVYMHYMFLLVCLFGPLTHLKAQLAPETHHYAIDVAGARVGTMTAIRQVMPNKEVVYTQISDVKVNLLVYKVIIYYKVVSRLTNGQLMLATVDARTNRGTYNSRTEWTGNHYVITANQYKYSRQAAETKKIDYTVSMMYFSEPTGRQRAYTEYFGDYFSLAPSPNSGYRAQLADREDEYFYEKGRLVRVVKKNAIKNFNIRLLD